MNKKYLIKSPLRYPGGKSKAINYISQIALILIKVFN